MAQFLVLARDEPSLFGELSPEQMQKVIQKYMAWGDRLTKAGKLGDHNKLRDGAGRVLRGKDGTASVTDGPFVETKGNRRRVLGHRGRGLRRSGATGQRQPTSGVRLARGPSGRDALTANTRMAPNDVSPLVDHLFRRSAGRMVAALTARLGSGYLDLAEEVVQDAMLRALQVWPARGIPPNPAGWLFQVARNRAIDRLRRATTLTAKLAALTIPEASHAEPGEADPLADDELRLIFMCCHPELPAESRVALTLKVACGFGVDEIARAFLINPTAVSQRLVRAKRLLREREVDLAIPAGDAAPGRLATVLEVVYLTFNEGYGAHVGDDLIRADLCHEAIRLGELLARRDEAARPEIHALLAMMYLHTSRLPARVDEHGAVVLLADQDRRRWDRNALTTGFRHLERSAFGERMTPYHVEAAIAAVHAAAARYEDTDWRRLLALYDQRLAMGENPVVRLNRAVAVGMVDGPAAAMAAALPLLEEPALASYYLLPATLGDLAERLGRLNEAGAWYRRAAELPCSGPELRLLEGRLRRLASAGP